MRTPHSIFLTKDPLSRMAHEVDRIFESLAPSSFPVLANLRSPRTTFPMLNLWEDGEKMFAEAELPGVKPGDIEVSATRNWLTIKGRREIEYEDDATVLRRERASGSFERSVELPNDIETDKIEASFVDGVLRITMPKAKEARRRLIKIKGQ